MYTNSRREYVLNEIASYGSQAAAAEALGTSPQVVSRWNCGESQPSGVVARTCQLARFIRELGYELPPNMEF
ncbi:MAG: hypothetical protein KAF91_00800 [Nostoc sp. TH1S01]|nr:hypothetical protein [Nostoc sp. TH1S01]OCQ92262.1 hypothetical protein BCD64_00155 [Nostoc sp. MBR 210]